MALPAIADLRRHAPDAQLVVAARPSVAPLFTMAPYVDGVVTLKWKGRALDRTALKDDVAELQKGVQRIFPDYFRQMVFVSVGQVDFDRFKGQHEVENLKASVEADLKKYEALAEKWGFAAEYRAGFGVDLIDELEEPLMHIIRNAVDHGIERQDERAAKGKSHAGAITLSACQESSYVIIKVTDDGKGIDLERVRERALEKGLVKPDEPFDHERAVSCILSAGFSTRDEVTEVSGRGVGLDVVNRNIAGLNGSVSVESLRGRGATVTMKVPLSLAIIPALMAEVGDEVYAIPMTSVDESVKVFEDDIHVINSREVVRFREQVLPVVRLNTFFGLRRRNGKRFYLVIISKAEKKIALAVDRLRGRQEIVIKPLDDTFARSRGIAGASILGDGRIVLIVDVMSFYEKKEVVESV